MEFSPAELEAGGWSLLEVVVAAWLSALSVGIKEELVVESLVVDGRSLRVVDDGRGVAIDEDGEDSAAVAVGSWELSEGLSFCRRAKYVAAGTAATE